MTPKVTPIYISKVMELIMYHALKEDQVFPFQGYPSRGFHTSVQNSPLHLLSTVARASSLITVSISN